MQKKYYIFNCIIICIYVLFVLLNCFISNGEYSELENRYLQKKPEISALGIADRSYMNDLENHTNDHIMFRSFFIKSKAFIERLSGKKENNGVYYGKDGYIIEKPHEYNEKLISENINSIIEFSKNKRYKTAVCIIPQAFEVLKDKLPLGAYNNSVTSVVKKIETDLTKADISFVNPTDVLNANNDDYIFYRTDHHQTSIGSYLTYVALADVLDYIPVSILSCDKQVASSGFYGTTYSKGLKNVTGDDILVYSTEVSNNATVEFYGENKTSDSIYFEEHLDKKDKYSYFLDGNHGITVVKGGKPNGKSIAVFKDSYAHSITPFLINNYENIHLIDMRYYNDDPMKYLAQSTIEQVLFLYGTSTFMSDKTIALIGDYAKNSPYAKCGLVAESEKVDDGYFSDAVFLGDSLTMGFEAFSGLDNAQFICRTSMSVGGVFLTESDGTNLVQKVKNTNSKKIYVMLGVNENIAPDNKAAVIEKYSRVIDALKQDNPDAMIYIQSILPVSKTKEVTGKIKNNVVYDYNESIRQLCEEKFVYYIDLYKGVTDNNGYLIDDITVDGVHLGEEGCKLWLEYLKTHAVIDENASQSFDNKEEAISVVSFSTGKYNLDKICENIIKESVFEGDIGTASPKNLLKTHNIDQSMVKNAVGLVGGGAFAEEIFLIELNDSSDAKETEKLLKEYVKTRIGSFESYVPKEVPKLKNAIVYSKDNFVALVVSSDNGCALDVLKKVE